jgi:hypothetical protein
MIRDWWDCFDKEDIFDVVITIVISAIAGALVGKYLL